MPHAAVTVREATPRDRAPIVGFQQQMALETEGKSLDGDLLERGVASVFQSRDKGFYVVTESDEQIVGSLLITYESLAQRQFLVDSERVRGCRLASARRIPGHPRLHLRDGPLTGRHLRPPPVRRAC